MMRHLVLKNITGYAYDFYLDNKEGKPSFANAEEAAFFVSLFEPMIGITRVVFRELLSTFDGNLQEQKQALIDDLVSGKIRVEQQKEIVIPPPATPPPRPHPSPPPPPPRRVAPKPTEIMEPAQFVTATTPAEQSIGAADTETCGDPIVMSSGEEYLSLTDVTLYAYQPLVFKRHYRSGLADQHVGMGLGWRSNFHYTLEVQNQEGKPSGWWFTDDHGQRTFFTYVPKGSTSSQLSSGMILEHRVYEIVIFDRQNQRFKFVCKDQHWLLTGFQAHRGESYVLTYSRSRRLTEITLNYTNKLFLRYNQRGQLIELRSSDDDSEARVYAQYQYDESQQLISATNRLGQCEYYAYYKGLMIRRTRASGFSHYFNWSDHTPQAKCVEQWGDHEDYHYRFEYEPGGISRSYDSYQNCWTYHHNPQGQCIKKIAPDGATWEYRYDALQRKIFARLPNGLETHFAYNEEGQLYEERNNAGERTRYGYNRLGLLAKTVYTDGSTLEQNYDYSARLKHSVDRQGVSTRYRYNKHDCLIKTESSNGIDTYYWWNDKHQLKAQEVGEALTRFSYNARGECNGKINHAGLIDVYERNAQGQIITHGQYHEDQPDQQRYYEYDYDDAGRLISITDPLSRQTRYEYQDLSQISKQINPDGSWLAFDYDRERNLTQIQRSDGATYQLSYDHCERITKTVGFDGREQHYQYNLAGQLTELRENNDRIVKLKYNALGRVTEQVSHHANGQDLYNRYEYDDAQRLTVAHNVHRSCAFKYDPFGRLISHTQGRWAITHSYNQQGRRSESQLCDGHTLGFTYTAHGQLSGITLNEKPVLTRQCDELGQEHTRELSGTHHQTTHYDDWGRIKTQQLTTPLDPITRHYHFDDADQLVTVQDSEQGAQHYHYDLLSQLTRVTRDGEAEQRFEFDAYGNPTQSRVRQDKLGGDNKHFYEYDALGNQTHASHRASQQNRHFNGLNQLIRLNHNHHPNDYEYDALGRRCTKDTGHVRTDYLWDDNHLIGEHSKGEFTWYVYEPDSYRPLLMIKDGQVYHYHLDPLGTPIRLTDQAGTIVWQAHYQAYGKVDLSVNIINNPLRFQGQYFDEESGLHYNLHRYYCPEQGRYIQQDPIGLLGGLNPYQYTPSPTNWVDPLGLCKEESNPLMNAALFVGGITKFWGDSTTAAIKATISDPIEVGYQALSTLVDTAYYPIDYMTRPLGITTGAVDRTVHRVERSIKGVTQFANEITENWDTADWQGLGSNLAAIGMVTNPKSLVKGQGGAPSLIHKQKGRAPEFRHRLNNGKTPDDFHEFSLLNHKKAATGEYNAHALLTEKGYQPLGHTDGIFTPGAKGIDGIYQHPNPPPDFVITEAKYNTARLAKTKDGKQMSDKWVTEDRLRKAGMNREQVRFIREGLEDNDGTVEKLLIRNKPDGSLTVKQLDEDATIASAALQL